MSQPSWAAWIEIAKYCWPSTMLSRSQPSWAAWIEIKGFINVVNLITCRSPLGLRGLKFFLCLFCIYTIYVAALLGCVDWNRVPKSKAVNLLGRSPLGLRGLKYHHMIVFGFDFPSQPSWAAWIEIISKAYYYCYILCRSPLGLRGLK